MQLNKLILKKPSTIVRVTGFDEELGDICLSNGDWRWEWGGEVRSDVKEFLGDCLIEFKCFFEEWVKWWEGERGKHFSQKFCLYNALGTVDEELWMKVHNSAKEAVTKTTPKKKKCKEAKWLSEEALKRSQRQRRQEKIHSAEFRVPENSKET